MKQTYIYPQTSFLSADGMFIMAGASPEGSITGAPQIGEGGIPGVGTTKMPKKI